MDTRVAVGPVAVHATQFDSVVERLANSGVSSVGSVRLVNAWCVVVAEDDAAYRDVVNGPGLSLPDGAPIVKVMRRDAAAPHAERVRGPSLFVATLDRGRDTGLRHYLLGGSPETLARLNHEIERRYPGANVVGSWSPPYAPIDSDLVDEACARVETTGADIVWVGLGAPKQDMLAAAISAKTGLTTVGVGAAFDFVAGTVPEAPAWMHDAGLEWLFRLAMEPRRLWRRYLLGNVRFLKIVGLR